MLRYSVMVFIGLFAIVTGLVVFFLLADGTRKAILQNIVIDSDTHANYNDWLTDWDTGDEATYNNYYLFNLTNPVAWAAGEEKANFAEIGPFVYRKYVNKTNVTFGNGGNDVSWNPHTEYIFQAEKSVSSDADTFVFNINPYYVAALQKAAGSEAIFNLGLTAGALSSFNDSAAWGGGTPVGASVAGFAQAYSYLVNLTATESAVAMTAFAGNGATLAYYSTLIGQYNAAVAAGQAATAASVGATLNSTFPGGPDYITSFSANFGAGAVSTTKASLVVEYATTVGAGLRTAFAATVGSNGGLLYRKISARAHLFGPDPLYAALTSASIGYMTNHTTSTAAGKRYTVKTGKDSSSVAGMDHHTQANGVSSSTAYTKADGSGPTVVVNGRTHSMAPFQGATPDKIEEYFEENERYVSFIFNGVKEVEEIETARYLADGEAMTAKSVDWNITAAGFAPLSYWAMGIPFFMSLPHQRYAAAPYSTAVTGQTVDIGKHSTFLDLEPITGYPLAAQMAAQMNLQMNFTATTYGDVTNVTEKNAMFPLYWFSQTYSMNPASATKLREAVVTAVVLRRAILGSLVGLGVVCVLIGAALMVQKGGNDGVSAGEAEKAAQAKKAQEKQQQESELPPDNEPELQPFNPPPAVTGEDDEKEMQQVGPST